MEFDGFNVADSYNHLSKNAYCLINLHGTYHSKSRWIMNGDQRESLIAGAKGAKFSHFISRVFSEYNVVFVGMNPSDVAISPFLRQATKNGLLGNHYWICPNPKADVSRWAQKHGVRLIAYSPEVNEDGLPNHSQDICAILDHLDRAESEDERVRLPNNSERVDPKSIGEPGDFLSSIISDRRSVKKDLEGAIAHIGDEFGYSSRELSDFLTRYKVPIQFASTVSELTPDFDEVMSYSVVKNLQSGGSSSVWLARKNESDADYVALKILSPDKLESLTVRQSFRRGVESLYLLTQENSGVAPKYLQHSELPLSVAMELIDGSTLSDFCQSFRRVEGKMLITLFKKICEAIRACHQSPGRVLHRDVKPGNIMLEGWHQGYELVDAVEAKIRLINFDLSWHRFTTGDTKSISAEDIGYYAPEQRRAINSLPPRSAETDVYMLGMVFYFLCSRTAPPDGGAALSDWSRMVRAACRRVFKDALISVRVQRLIEDMTDLDMEKRVELSVAIAELDGLLAWINKQNGAIDDEYIIEYLALKSDREYRWDGLSYRAQIRTRESTELSVKYLHKGRRVEIEFFRQKSAADTRASFGGKLRQRITAAGDALKAIGWNIDSADSRGLKAQIRIEELKLSPDFGAETWREVSDSLLRPVE